MYGAPPSGLRSRSGYVSHGSVYGAPPSDLRSRSGQVSHSSTLWPALRSRLRQSQVIAWRQKTRLHGGVHLLSPSQQMERWQIRQKTNSCQQEALSCCCQCFMVPQIQTIQSYITNPPWQLQTIHFFFKYRYLLLSFTQRSQVHLTHIINDYELLPVNHGLGVES